MIATAVTIAEYALLDAEAAEKAVNRLSSAERDARQLIGDDEYDRIAALAPDASEDLDAEYAALLEAESLLAAAYALPFLNLRISERGGLISAVGMDASRTELLSSFQARTYQSEYRRQAHQILSRFLSEERAYVY